MRFLKLLGPILACLFWAMSAFAQSPRVDQVQILEAGIYEPGPANSLQFVQPASEIPGRVGTKFGFRYALVGPGSALPAQMQLVIRLPQRLGQVDPATGQRRFRIEEPVVGRVGGANVSGYSFDAPWEIAFGEWIFEIWIGGNKRAEQRFVVVRP